MSMLSDFAEAVDLFAKSRLNAGSQVASCQSSESSRDMDLAESKSGRSSVLSEISGLVRYMSHKEKVERGYEVLLEDYDGFHNKNAPIKTLEEDKSTKTDAECTEADSLLQLLDDVDRMDGEKAATENSTSPIIKREVPEVAASKDGHDNEKPVGLNVTSATSNSIKSSTSQRSRKSLSSRPSHKDTIPESPEEEDEEAEDPEEEEEGEKPQTIEIPQVASVVSKSSAKSLKSTSAASMVIQPIVSMLSMGSIKSVSSMKPASSNRSVSSKKSRASVVVDSPPPDPAVSTLNDEEEHPETIEPQPSMLSQASKASRKSITFSDVVETNEGKSEPMLIEKSASTLSKTSIKSLTPEDEPMVTHKEECHQIILSHGSIQSKASKSSRKSVSSLLSRKSKSTVRSESQVTISTSDSAASRGLTKHDSTGIVIPPALSMKSNTSKASRKSIVSMISRKSKDADAPDIPAVESNLSKKSYKSESGRSVKSNGSRKSTASMVSSNPMDTIAPEVPAVESGMSKFSNKSESTGYAKSSGSKKSVNSLKSISSVAKHATFGADKESGVILPSQLSMKSHESKNSRTDDSVVSINSKSIAESPQNGDVIAVVTVDSDLSKKSSKSKNVLSTASTVSKKSTFSGDPVKFLGEFPIEEETREEPEAREELAEENASVVDVIPSQVSMRSRGSRTSNKSIVSRLSLRKPKDEQTSVQEVLGKADYTEITKVESSLSRKSSKSFSSRILKTLSKLSATTDEVKQGTPAVMPTEPEAAEYQAVAVTTE